MADDEVLADGMGDLNVTITDKEIDVNNKSAIVVSFDWPSGGSDWDQVDVNVGGQLKMIIKEDCPSGKVPFSEFNINKPGTYNVEVSYQHSIVATGNLTVTNSTSKTYTDKDFITELYSTQEYYGKPVDGVNNRYICTFMDSVSGLNGVITIYANNTAVFNKTFKGDNKGGVTIFLENLTGKFNGDYNIKVTYQRNADGKLYSREKLITFVNATGNGTGSDPIKNTDTNTNTNTNDNTNTDTPDNEVVSLTLKKVKVIKKSKKLVLKATLKINFAKKKGKKVTFKFNGKKYTAKTNKKGVAKLPIKKSVLKKLKVGKKVKVQASYKNKVKKFTARVKK